MENTVAADGPPLYRQLANHISAAIAAGTLRAGDRLPSVRHLSKQHAVSVSTALQVYRYLENLALVEAKPKSGYFVKANRPVSSHTPSAREPGMASDVGVNDAVFEFIKLGRDGYGVRLDVATGPAEVYPTAKIQQLINSISRRHPEIITNYPTGTGNGELKSQIARRALDAGCQISPDELIITSGSTESMNLALRATTKPGDTVAVESPTYFGILQILESLGLRALEIPTNPRTGISVEALDFATGTPGAVQAVVLMPNFHNPLGSLMPDEHKARLVQLLASRDIPLIEDDVYGDIYYGERRPVSTKAFDKTRNVILCNSATKTLAPGLRIGWIVPGRWQARVEMLKFTSSIVTPELAQVAIAEFMRNGSYDHHMRKFRSGAKKQTRLMIDAVCRYFPAGTGIADPQGGYLLWIELPEAIPSRKVFDLARKQSIGIAPGLMFSASGRFDHYIRLNCGYPWNALIEDSVKKVGEIVRTCMGG